MDMRPRRPHWFCRRYSNLDHAFDANESSLKSQYNSSREYSLGEYKLDELWKTLIRQSAYCCPYLDAVSYLLRCPASLWVAICEVLLADRLV